MIHKSIEDREKINIKKKVTNFFFFCNKIYICLRYRDTDTLVWLRHRRSTLLQKHY